MYIAAIAGLGVDGANEVSQVRRPSDKTAADEFWLGASGSVSEIAPGYCNDRRPTAPRKSAKFGGRQTELPRMGSVKPHGDVFQLSSSGDVSKIEPALQDTVVAAIAGPGIVARVLAGARNIAGLGVDSAKKVSQVCRPSAKTASDEIWLGAFEVEPALQNTVSQ